MHACLPLSFLFPHPLSLLLSIMPYCPTEILDIILGNVDDAHGHYACLPINKHAFRHAATMLYTDPLQTLHCLDSSRRRRFLCWLFSISHTHDDFTNEREPT